THVILQTASLVQEEITRRAEGLQYDVLFKPYKLEEMLGLIDKYARGAAPGASASVHKILLVDDDPLQLESLKTFIELDPEFGALTANTGKSAIETLEKHPQCEVAIVDLKLPDIDGIELAGRLKSIQEELTVI